MRLSGREVLEHWREAGEWWAGELPREVLRYLDEKGIRRTHERQLPALQIARSIEGEYRENHQEEICLQKAARRKDSWAEYASRGIDESFYESYRAKDIRRLANHGQRVDLLAEGGGFPFVPLHCLSGYAFGRGLIHASDLPALAALRGFPAVAIADPHSLVGCIEFVRAAKKVDVKPLVGAAIELADHRSLGVSSEVGGQIVLIARSKHGYRHLSTLVSRCHLEEPRLFPLGTWSRVADHASDLVCLTGGHLGPINRMLALGDREGAEKVLRRLLELFGSPNVFLEIERSFVPWELRVNRRLLELAERYGVLPVAGGQITHERRLHFPAQDVLACADTLCTVDEIVGRKPQRDITQPHVKELPARWLNAERFFPDARELTHRFQDAPELVANTLAVADRCDDEVLPGRTRLPKLYEDDNRALIELTWEGALRRHRKIDSRLKRRLDNELERIVSLGYAGQFLVIHDACEWAREQHILFSGRGSVVDSAVAYCLGLSRIDAHQHRLHFDRFLPCDGSKRPDIDIDFEAHRRDDVRNYLRKKYGEDRVATVAAVGTYGTRGIIREVGKALGLSDAVIGQFAKLIHGGVSPEHLDKALDARPELRDSGIPRERFRWIVELAPMIADIPRNIRAHSSGVVISSEPLCHTVPVMYSGVEDVPIIQWDKRSAKHYFDKFDILCLRGQDVLSGTQERIRLSDARFDVEQISLQDEDTYRTMRSGELIGIPQSASPAMRQAHIRLRTSNLHDASLVQAGIRPGVGGAVKLNELIARRRGKPYRFLHPELETILGHTYGIIVFQEQVDQLLQTFCGYTSGEAEAIREAIHENRRMDYGQSIRDELYTRMASLGHSRAIADHVFDLVAGFKGYGFAQGHALAFAEISIRSIYCQQNFPAEYFAALLDAQPAGYYGPCTLANEARVRGVAMLPPDVNRSALKFLVEDVKSEQDPKIVLPNAGIRISLNQISGISVGLRERIVAERERAPFASFFDFVARVMPERDELERLVLCGALDCLHPNRRALLWAIPSAFAFGHTSRAMAQGLGLQMPEPALPDVEDFVQHEKAIYERAILGLDIAHHLMAFERERIAEKGVLFGSDIKHLRHGERAIVVGNPIRLRFPPTASGKRVVFFDLEDESGLLNVTCFDDVYRRDGHAIVACPYVTIRGEAQDRDGHMAFLAHRVFPYQPKLNVDGIAHLDSLFDTADFLAR